MHRLGELNARQRVVAGLLVALLLVPFVVSVLRAHHVGWLPSGDDALIGLRSWDVFSRHRPLVGQPSTSYLYASGDSTAHPGPIEFYWLAVPIRLLGPAAGMIAGSLVVNLASVLVACWVVFRRAGAGPGAAAVALAGCVLWSEGTALLTDPISSNAGGLPLLALAALGWAVIDGDWRLLPLTAVFASWVAQQHLAIVGPAAAMAALALAGVVVREVAALRTARAERGPVADDETDETADDVTEDATDGSAGESDEGDEPLAEDVEPAANPRRWPWYAGAAGVSLVLWSPVLWQQLTGHPGNLTAIIHYARSSDTPPLGVRSGARQAIRALGFPPLLGRSDLWGGAFFRGPLGAAEVVFGVVGYAVLVATVVWAWARRRTLSLLALTALVLAAAGAYTGSKIPSSIEAYRINFYRWAFVVAWLGWLVFAWLAAIGIRALATRVERVAPLRTRLAPLAPVAAVFALLVPIGAIALTHPGWDDERRDQVGFTMMHELGDAARHEAAGHGRVTLVLRGGSANLSTGPAIAVQLVSHGHPVLVDTVVAPGIEDRFWGEQRILRHGDDPGAVILLVASGLGTVGDLPGRTVARVALNASRAAALAVLLPEAAAASPVPSVRAEVLLAQHYGARDRAYVRDHVMTRLRTHALTMLSDPTVLEMIIDGYYATPTFDRGALLQLQAAPAHRDVNLDDVFELRVLTRAELAELVPAWAGT